MQSIARATRVYDVRSSAQSTRRVVVLFSLFVDDRRQIQQVGRRRRYLRKAVLSVRRLSAGLSFIQFAPHFMLLRAMPSYANSTITGFATGGTRLVYR